MSNSNLTDVRILSELPLESLIEAVVQRLSAKIGAPGATPQAVEIIDAPELCKRLSISRQTLIAWQNKGRIPVLRVGAICRYDFQEVIRSISETGKK